MSEGTVDVGMEVVGFTAGCASLIPGSGLILSLMPARMAADTPILVNRFWRSLGEASESYMQIIFSS